MAKNKEQIKLYYEGCCAGFSTRKCDSLMKNRRRFSYKRLVSLIKKQYPDMYEELGLEFPNPWSSDTWKTPIHLIMNHSSVEYFFRYRFLS